MTNEQYIWEFLISKGCNEFGAAGAMGNIYTESGFVPTNLQNSFEKSLKMTDFEYTNKVDNGTYSNFIKDSAGYGLVQWTYWSLKEELYNYAKSINKSIGNLEMQCDFLWIQLNSSFKPLVAILKNAKSVKEASNAFMLQFERPADQSITAQQKREGFGITFYEKYSRKETITISNQEKEVGNGYKYDYQPATNGIYWNLPDIKVTGLVLHSVGCPQPKAQVFVNSFNKKDARASVHGFIEPGLYIETAPTRVAKAKAKKCYHVGGNWNNSRIGIEMCEPATIKYTSGSIWKDLNPSVTKKYILDVTATAAQVFADLCIYHGLPVALISTHAEAYKKGQGSNHGDPDHIWRPVGYSLDKFRQDVQKIINDRKGDYLSLMTKTEFEQILEEKLNTIREPIYEYLADIPIWGKEAVKNAMSAGVLNGVGKDAKGEVILNLPSVMLRMIVMNNNLGLYTKKTDK